MIEADVMGLDLSLNGTGISTLDGDRSLVFKGRKADPKGDERLTYIRNVIETSFWERGFDLVVIESLPPYGTGTKALGLVHGVARQILSEYHIPVMYLSPSALKLQVTGSGRATKGDMAKAYEEVFGVSPKNAGIDDNAVDAAFLRQVGLWHLYDRTPHLGWVERDKRPMLKKVD